MVVQISNLSYIINKKIILSNINLKLENGRYCLIGPNGSGKTTLVNIIANLILPTEGSVLISKDYRIATLQAGDSLYTHLLVGKQLLWYAEISGFDVSYLNYLLITYLPDIQYNYYGNLSSGQRQRACLIASLIGRPNFLILDEPTSHLDRSACQDVWSLIKKINTDEGIGYLIVTHDNDELVEMADGVILMVDGMIKNLSSVANYMQYTIHISIRELISQSMRDSIKVKFGSKVFCGSNFVLVDCDLNKMLVIESLESHGFVVIGTKSIGFDMSYFFHE